MRRRFLPISFALFSSLVLVTAAPTGVSPNFPPDCSDASEYGNSSHENFVRCGWKAGKTLDLAVDDTAVDRRSNDYQNIERRQPSSPSSSQGSQSPPPDLPHTHASLLAQQEARIQQAKSYRPPAPLTGDPAKRQLAPIELPPLSPASLQKIETEKANRRPPPISPVISPSFVFPPSLPPSAPPPKGAVERQAAQIQNARAFKAGEELLPPSPPPHRPSTPPVIPPSILPSAPPPAGAVERQAAHIRNARAFKAAEELWPPLPPPSVNINHQIARGHLTPFALPPVPLPPPPPVDPPTRGAPAPPQWKDRKKK